MSIPLLALLIPRVLTFRMDINSVSVPASKGDGAPFVSLDSGAAPDFKSSSPLAVYAGDGPLVLFVVGGDGDVFYGRFVDALCFDRAAFALARFGEVELFAVAAVFSEVLPEGYFFSLTAKPVIPVFMVGKSLRTSFVASSSRSCLTRR